MKWTEEQRATIETTGKNILVSAAAGSGKTTVLVERIKNLVINEGADIGSFLITTYTKAAAAEMKERLEKAIRTELKKPDADKTMLIRQLQQLPAASISTFHSFAIDILRQYFYLTDLEPGFEIADDVQVSIMKKNAIDKVFSERYEENTEAFRDFVLKYSSAKSDDQLKDNILDTYRTLQSIPDYFEWAHAKADLLGSEDPMAELGGYRMVAGMIMGRIASAVRYYDRAADAADDFGLPNIFAAASDDAELIREIHEKACIAFACPDEKLADAVKGFGESAFGYKLSTMSWKKDGAGEEEQKIIKGLRDRGKKQMDEARGLITGRSFEDYNEELRGIHADTVYYIELIEEFEGVLREMKAKAGVIDFDDIMHYCIKILQNDDAAAELREKYNYIFVDEYQDSNYLQEEIIRRIARGDNLFMVGDVKQCIYKFRLAEPELFMEKARIYDREDEGNSILLNLSSNFRSKKNVTEPVNDIFANIMDGYDDRAKLHCTAPDEYPGFPARIHIIGREDFDKDSPDKSDSEAAVIAEIIRERLGSEIYDAKAGQLRKVTLRDFAVIARNNSTVENVERYLNNEGIAAYGEGSGRYFETVEVQVFVNLLRITDNMRQDIPLISAMKSVVFGFSVSELARIRVAEREGTFYTAVMNYAEKGSDGRIKEKIAAMIETVSRWKEIGRTVPLEELIKLILYDTGYYDYCSGLPVGTQRISNLRLISEKASKYELMSHGGLHGFLKYIESLEDSSKTDSEAKVIGENEDVVRVMSVHKSKGLEFPIVIFANSGRQTISRAGKSGIYMHRDLGIGLPSVNRKEHWHRKTFLQKMIDSIHEKEMIEEEIRILYVALTRAKDGLEIVGTVKDSTSISEEISTATFLDMMYVPLSERSEVDTIIYNNPDELEQSHVRRMHSAGELFAKAEEAGFGDDEISRMIGRRLGFEYPYADQEAVRPKYSVSQLNGSDTAERITVASFEPEDTDRPLSAAEIGTAMHLLMEKLDFVRALEESTDYIRQAADRLLASEKLTAAEYDSLSIENAASFFAADPGMRAAQAAGSGRLQREKEFILEEEIDGVRTVVQGIIDCFFEEDDGIVLIDYKNSSLAGGRTHEEIAADYREQINLYSRAIEGATGCKVKEAYLFLFQSGEFIKMTKCEKEE